MAISKESDRFPVSAPWFISLSSDWSPCSAWLAVFGWLWVGLALLCWAVLFLLPRWLLRLALRRLRVRRARASVGSFVAAARAGRPVALRAGRVVPLRPVRRVRF